MSPLRQPQPLKRELEDQQDSIYALFERKKIVTEEKGVPCSYMYV